MRFDGVAGGLQQVVEEMLTAWASLIVEKTGRRSVSFGGGVAMNVKANKAIAAVPGIADFFVPLSPGDESNVFGAVYQVTAERMLQQGRDPIEEIPGIDHAYLCPDFSSNDVEAALTSRNSAERYEIMENADVNIVAQLLERGETVARCMGHGEFGLRALGNRSILANPSAPGVVERINRQIKNRDFWMPFAPTILSNRQQEIIENPKGIRSPFMTMSFDVKPGAWDKMAGALHPADKTARPQLLEPHQNPEYYELIQAFSQRTGIPAVLNTSFNLHGEPIVSTPEDALHVFENSELDNVWIGEVLIRRKRS